MSHAPDHGRGRPRFAWRNATGAALAVCVLAALAAGPAAAQEATFFSDDFESTPSSIWSVTGDWRFKENSPCLPNELGYLSETHAMAFDFGTTCAYRNNRAGFATMRNDVLIPITTPTATLTWWDFVGAELGSDFYFVQISTDGGQTWPHEVFRDSTDELFWDQESVDLSEFIGQSIRVRFGFTTDSTITNLGWYIDDVAITGEALADGVSAIAISGASSEEDDLNNPGTPRSITFTLDIEPANDEPIELEHATLNQTAIAGLDYLARSGPITIPAGVDTFDINVTLFSDVLFEDDETFRLLITNPTSNAIITIEEAIGTILDNESLQCLEIAPGVTLEDFTPPAGSPRWTRTGLWYEAQNSACIPGEDGFTSPTYAMAYNDMGTCTYDTIGGTTGALTMVNSVTIPADALSAQLSFSDYLEIAWDNFETAPSEARVEVSTNGTIGPFTPVKTFKPDAPSNDLHVFPWNEEVVNLNAYIGQPIVIRFVFEQPAEVNRHTANGWFIDDVQICYAPLPNGVSKVTVNSVKKIEGNDGTTKLEFGLDIQPPVTESFTVAYQTIQLNPGDVIDFIDPDTTMPASVMLEAKDIATGDEDYVNTVSQLTVTPADQATAKISVLVAGEDQPEEMREYLKVALNSVSSNIVLDSDEVIGIIEDDDAPSRFIVTLDNNFADVYDEMTMTTLTANAIQIVEADTTVTIDVQLSPPRTVDIEVDYFTEDVSAQAGLGLDYLSSSGTLFIPANTEFASFTVTINDDEFYEDPTGTAIPPAQPDPEEFLIHLVPRSSYAQERTKTVEIEENDPGVPPGVSILTINDVTITEGSCPEISAEEPCGTLMQAEFTVSLDMPPSALAGESLVIQYQTVDGTAIGGEDYVPAEGLVVFTYNAGDPSMGDDEQTISVDIWADRMLEGDETFQILLSSPSPAQWIFVGDNKGVATIRNDDYLSTSFGARGEQLVRRDLPDGAPVISGLIDDITLAMPNAVTADLTTAEFKGFEFDTLFGFDEDDTFKTINLVTGEVANGPQTVLAMGEYWSGLAWDHTNGRAYAVTTLGDLHEFDLATGMSAGSHASGFTDLVAVAVHPTTGRIYVARVDSPNTQALLYEIIPGEWTFNEVGVLTEITPGDDTMAHLWDMDFDDNTGLLYLNALIDAVPDDIWVMRRVDVSNAETRLVIELPDAGADPPVSPLAIASPPAPASVHWTSDLEFSSTAPNGFDLTADPATLNGAEAGAVVSGIGDVNGDGVEDFAIAAKDADVGANPAISAAGKVFIFYGGQDPEFMGRLVDQAASDVTFGDGFLDGVSGFVLNGSAADSHFGTSVSGVGDVNGDNIADFVISYIEANGKGGAYLVFGDRLFPDTVTADMIGDDDLQGEIAGVKIVGAANDDWTGFSVSGIGDFNSDGFSDFALGAPGNPAGSARPGRVYLIFGSNSTIGSNGILNLTSLAAPSGIRILGEDDGDEFGFSLSGAGDVNGDGIADVIIGAPGSNTDQGRAFILLGHVDYADEDAPNPINLARLGDGRAPGTNGMDDPGAPDSLIFTTDVPAPGELADSVTPPITFPDTFGTLVGELPGLIITGESGRFGVSVTGPGDVNGDGMADIVAGAPGFDGSAIMNVEPHWGRSYLVFGDEAFDAAVDAADIGDTVEGVLLMGVDDGDGDGLGADDDGDGSGARLAGAGDINGDGYMDLLIGAKGSDRGLMSGEIYAVYGRAGLTGALSLRDLANVDPLAARGFYLYNTNTGANFELGRSVSAAGDFNDDGIPDYVVGRNGGAFVVFGEERQVSATYTSRMRSGESAVADDLPDTGDQSGISLGQFVRRGVGMTGDGHHSIPASRLAIEFREGGAGASLKGPSTQVVSVFRQPSPDIIVGNNTPEDDARWVPADIFWKVETNRTEFTQSSLEFYYRDAEVEGFELEDVGVFYAKPDKPLSETTAWSWLPFEYDSDRRVFTVTREHATATAQDDVNGYYALVKADLVTDLGGVIPAVGVTNDKVYQGGPIVTPENMAFWHARDKKLYATKAGPLVIEWLDEFGNEVSEVEALNVWPTEEDKYQPYISGSPSVDLNPEDSAVTIQFAELTDRDPGVVANSEESTLSIENHVQDNKQFAAKLNNPAAQVALASTDPSVTKSRAMLLLSNNADATQGDIYFQFIQTLAWNNPEILIGGSSGLTWPIGQIIDEVTSTDFADNHDLDAGAPFIFFEKAPYAPYSERYSGFYNREDRTGSIVPVNTATNGRPDLVLVFYKPGLRLIDAQTGNPLRADEPPRAPIPTFQWPHVPAKYAPTWPTNAKQIIISRQDGSGEIDVATFGTTHDIYFENTSTATGYNPNEEHAIIRPYAGGQAVFALRNDLNSASSSEPYVLMTYNDPADLDSEGDPKAKMRPFRVTASTPQFPFGPKSSLSVLADPYKGEVGAFILPPYPLSTFAISEDNSSPDLPQPGDSPAQARTKKIFKDRNSSLWAKSRGTIVSRFYYPPHPDFFYPSDYLAKHLADGRDILAGDDVPLLDGPGSDTNLLPVNVSYFVDWPEDVPTMKIGEILLEAKFGLPQINGQCSVDFIFEEEANLVKLIDPIQSRSVEADLEDAIQNMRTTFREGEVVFPDLPPAINFRLSYNQSQGRLKWKGIIVDPLLGFDYVLLNVINGDEKQILLNLSTDAAWREAINALADPTGSPAPENRADETFDINDSSTDPFDALGLTTGDARGTGYVTLAFQNADNCAPLPVSLAVIRVVGELTPGNVAVVKPDCVFEEKLTLMHTGDFGGKPENYDFEWAYVPDQDGTLPDPPSDDFPAGVNDPWTAPPLNGPSAGQGLSSITIEGPGLLTLTDNWFAVRYRVRESGLPWSGVWSDWTPVQLGEGWIKRVVGSINPFTQRAGGGGIAGAEASFASFGENAANTLVSMISQAGPRWTGDVPLNCDDLDAFGLIPIYETVLGRGADLSINALSPVNHPGVNTALLLVASRISDLYSLLGNEAFADAADPTIAFGTDDGVYGAEATSIHAFMNQTNSLLAEELGLLRGRDDTVAPGVQLFPLYNRFIWNFTRDLTGGEVAYALNYNITDDVENGDGTISETDAARLYPQGHGDAWGHYLKSAKTYYKLLNHPFYTWVTRSEALLVGGQPVTVDYLDERKFAHVAAAKARTGRQIVDLAYREKYVEDPSEQLVGYKDEDTDRAWGFSEWANRAATGAYFDWVVGNGILRAVDPDPSHQGITRIDRTTVQDLVEVASEIEAIQSESDMADLGLNPLGLGSNVIPFDISPSQIDDGQTHFEQVFSRALTAMNNAGTVFNHANNSTQLLRRQQDSQEDFQRGVFESELDFNARLIEIFGYPYPEDIGPGGTYPTGYNGPDLVHYMYREQTGLDSDGGFQNSIYFGAFDPTTADGGTFTEVSDIPTFLDSEMEGFAERDLLVNIGDGDDIEFAIDIVNYDTVNPVRSTTSATSQFIFQGIPGIDIPGGSTSFDSENLDEVLEFEKIKVKYNMRSSGGRFGLRKPTGWSERRAPGEMQLAVNDLNQQMASFMSSIDDYGGLVANIENQVDIVERQFNVTRDKLILLNSRLNNKKTAQDILLGIKTVQTAITRGVSIAEKIAEFSAESIPQVTGIIVGFSNGVIIDALAPARGALGGVGAAIVEGLQIISDIAELSAMRLEQEGARADDQLAINIEGIEGEFAFQQELQTLKGLLLDEVPMRLAMHQQFDGVIQAMGKYQQVLAEGQRLLDRRALFRRQTTADVQAQRYRDMAFRIFRNDALQKYNAQFDLAQRYVYMAAKAYDYETTMLSADQLAGQKFLTDIVKERQLGTIEEGLPITGVGLADSMAVMARNFEVLSTQLGFNNPQVETNRFSLRHELFRALPDEDGDARWRDVLSRDYFTFGTGIVENLWDVPEFRRFCVPPAGFSATEPGLVISFDTSIVEGENFFGQLAGGLDSAYDSTQFATKIRSAGVWFSNYDALNFSNTPRVYLIPVGIDKMRSPTGFSGAVRNFRVVDQQLPVPFPIGSNELDSPSWIPRIDTLSGDLLSIRRFGRLRAFHDSGEFSEDEVHRDSRLVGRSVWNTKWMLIVPASTLGAKPATGDDTRLDDFIGGVSDIKLFFETYAYPRLKKADNQ